MSRYIPCPIDGTPVDQYPERQGRPAKYCSDACRQRSYRVRRAPAPRYAACEHDGTPIEISGPGRPPRFCSSSCRVAAHRARRAVVAEAEEVLRSAADPIPAELRERARWVRLDLVRGRKLPLVARSGRAASSTDPSTWTTIDVAQASTVGRGLGYVLGDGIGCLDLDNCIAEDGTLSDLAEEALRLNPSAWVETSQSGRGLHIWGLRAEGPGRRTREIEVYSVGRYIALGETFRPGGLAPLVVPTD